MQGRGYRVRTEIFNDFQSVNQSECNQSLFLLATNFYSIKLRPCDCSQSIHRANIRDRFCDNKQVH